MTAISVVICTTENSGREARLAEVIHAINQQKRVEVEAILVWQCAEPALASGFDGLRTLATDYCGVSAARNRGATIASHDLISFYDDDASPVGEDLLARATAILNERNLDFLTCNIASSGVPPAAVSVQTDIVLGRAALVPHMWEPGLLIRRAAFEATRFDETLGVGCLHGSSEGLDLGARLLAKGCRGQRIASLLVEHPPLTQDISISTERAFFYSLGNGAALVRHGWYAIYAWLCFKTLGRIPLSLASLDSRRAKNAWVRLLGLLLGPLLPRRPARFLPRSHVPKPTRLIEPHG